MARKWLPKVEVVISTAEGRYEGHLYANPLGSKIATGSRFRSAVEDFVHGAAYYYYFFLRGSEGIHKET